MVEKSFASILIVAALALASPSRACKCRGPESLGSATARATAIFEGTVQSKRAVANCPPARRDCPTQYTIQVSRAWKGVRTSTVNLFTLGNSCDRDLHVGFRALFFPGYSRETNRLTSGKCFRLSSGDAIDKDASGLGAAQFPANDSRPDKTANRAKNTYVVRRGDTLQSIAAQIYRDPNQWRALALRNNIRDPRRLSPGMVLTIPALEE